MITLDASILIAHLRAEDRHHSAATSLLDDAAAEALVIHPVNLAEVLVGGVRAGRGREVLDDVLAMGVRPAQRDRDEPLRLATLRVEAGLKLPDCCALDTALATGSTLATTDDRLAAAARRRHLRVLPA